MNQQAALHPTTLTVLRDMYSADKLYGTESAEPMPLDGSTKTSFEQGAAIHALMRNRSIKRSLEVGMAYGFSTDWMIDALREHADSLHIAIDPFEKTSWHGIGLAQVARLGFKYNFQWIERQSIHALSDLIRRQEKFDFIYVDGNHRFDDVLVDFYLSDQILDCGGLIVFDDTWMQSVRTVVNFVIENRTYELVRQPLVNMAVLQKKRDDTRDWQHFAPFKIAPRKQPMLTRISSRILRIIRDKGSFCRHGVRGVTPRRWRARCANGTIR
jgi:predicted O-methyltransferase YrrM